MGISEVIKQTKTTEMKKIFVLLTIFLLYTKAVRSQNDQWVWMKGDEGISNTNFGIYGTQNVANSNNRPGQRSAAIYLTDASGNFWLFGGQGYGESTQGRLNDLWKYSPVTNMWTWVSGSKSTNTSGVYGTITVPSATNYPGARSNGSGWVDAVGNIWIFGGDGYAQGYSYSDRLNDLWRYNPTSNQWTWMSGNNTPYVSGVYGTMGTPSPANKPGSREGTMACKDNSGNFYLFGGYGYNESGIGLLNDLWRYNTTTNQWTWLKGDKSGLFLGVYGTQGTASATNKPGGREFAAMSIDASNNIWLFGGYGRPATNTNGRLSDLWRYNIATTQWTWMKGPNTINNAGVYGTMGTGAATNNPGARESVSSQIDGSGNFWLFGGDGYGASGVGRLNDLWRYNIAANQWVWIKGDNTPGGTTVFGTMGVPAAANKPGGRSSCHFWFQSTGNLWLFGGYTNNELWRFTISSSNWTWIRDFSRIGSSVYGTINTTNAANYPGNRYSAGTWMDAAGDFWLFGGNGVGGINQQGYLSDMWRYQPGTNQWTWTAGDSLADLTGNYGVVNVPAVSNRPGGRFACMTWKDNNGRLWLFGGNGYSTTATAGYLNDLWRFDPATSQWTWIKGDNTLNNLGSYGTIGVASATNKPGSRYDAITWTDSNGMLWLFGGYGYGESGGSGYLNDLWKFNPSTTQWTFIKGSKTIDNAGVYGVIGAGTVNTQPGGRNASAGFLDSDGNLWLFGGYGKAFQENAEGYLSDLWKYEPSTDIWTWVNGSDLNNITPVFGYMGVPSVENTPGGRSNMSAWVSNSDEFYLFGGGDALNDVWKYNRFLNVWTWVKGEPGSNPGIYGTATVPSVTNNPGGRNSSMSYKTSEGKLWMFGGSGLGKYISQYFSLNDLWNFNPCSGNLSITPASGRFCFGVNSIELTVSGGTGYSWYKDGILIPGQSGSTYTATTAGTYYVKSITGLCEIFSQTVVLGSASIAPSLGGNGVYCEGANVNVGIPETQNEQDYEWMGPASYYVPIGGGGGNQSLNFAMTASYSGTYIVESRKPDCDTVYSNPVSVYYGGVSELATTSVCPNQVSFSWRDYGSPVKIFQYAVTLSSSPPPLPARISTTSIGGSVGGLLPSTTYYIHVRGATIPNFDINSYTFCSNWTVISFTTPAEPPTPTLSPASATICQGNSQLLTATGGDTYQWTRDNNLINGVTSSTYNATIAGTYQVSASVNGCSSTLSNTSIITLTPTPTSTTNIAICSNQLPFSWNGNNYNTAGTYNVTLTTQAGCDSIATLNLTVSPPLTSTTNLSVCTNQLPYVWNGNNYSSAGTYNVTLIGSNGCDSIATLNLAINPTSSSITNVAVCSNLLPYSWNGNSYNAGGSYFVTLTGSNNCDSIATLNLSVNPVSTSTTNISICTNQLPYSWNGNNYNAGGTYNVTLPGTNGCDSIATLNLTVNTVLTSTTNASVCTNQLPFIWNGNNYNAAGTFNVILVSQSGCDSIATLNLSVNPILTSTTNASVCTNQLPYIWNGNNYNIAGTYNITLLGSNGCDSIATLNLLINQTSSSTTNISTCTNQLPYNWNGNSYNSAGTYVVTLTGSNGCDSVATLNLSVNVAATSTTNINICTNQLPYSWNGNNYNAGGIYSVTLMGSNGCDSIATLNLTVSAILTSTTNVAVCTNQLPYPWNGNNYNTAGTFNVTLVSQSGCDSIATLNLAINPVLTSTTNASTCSNQLPYNWNGNAYNTAGTYNVTLLGSNGCDSIATLNFSINSISSSITNVAVCSNQLPYNWNGNIYNGAGNYNVTLIGANGCDSIATLNLVVNAVQTSTTNVSICNNQLPYNWNGNNYNLAGIYTVTLVGSNGCDSIATLNLSIGTVLTSTTNVNVCANQLPYSWNGNSYNTAGSFNVTLVSQAGCDSIATLNLGVTPVLTSITNISRCENQLPYLWNGNNYTATGIYNITLAGSNGCDSIASLNLTVNPVLTSITNASICANQAPYIWNGNNYSTSGIYNVTLNGSNGCDSIATLNLEIKNIQTSSTNIEVCTNQLPYSWNGNNYTAAGSYNVTIPGSNGCDSIATLNLAIKPVATSTTSISICANQLPFSWNGNSYTASGSYNVILTGSNNCDSTATLILTVNSLPTGSISPGNATICIGSSQILTVSGGVSYQWLLNGAPINGATTDVITVTTQGIYSVEINAANGCKAMASNTANIQVIQKPITAFDFSALCQNEITIFNNTSTTGSSGTVNWSWNFGDNSTSSLFAPTHVYTQPGSYTVELIATPTACVQLADTIKKLITVIPATPGIRYDNVRVLKNTAFTLSARNIGVQYVWQPATALNNSTIQNPVVTTSADREYLVRIRIAAGCLVTDTVLVQAFDKADIYVPKAFTPNSNNANDKLRPLGVSAFSIDYFRVYNRWGQLMYQTQNVGEGWDGNYKNIPQPTETYTWVFLGKSQDGTIIKASGKTVLIR